MVLVMLAAQEPFASPSHRGMDCAGKANTANKKLVQARLPFKRLNLDVKESSTPKKTKGPVAPKCSEPSVSDGENDVEHSPLPQRRGPALVNGRGPLDSFMSRRKRSPISSAPEVTIDLTNDNSTDAVKQQPASPVAAACPVKEKVTGIEDAPESTEHTVPLSEDETDKDEAMEEEILPLLDTTQESDTEEEEQQETEVSHGNESVLSAGSASSLSEVESSPEPSKSAPSTPASASQANAAESKMKRRSLKSVQEQDERQKRKDEKERLKQEAKAAKEKKKEEARKLKEEKEKEKKDKKEKEEKERREKKEREEKEKAEKQRAKEEQRQMKIEAKLEEKRKKEEEKRLKEEKDRVKAEKANITRFLQKSTTQLAPKTLASTCGKFAPFEIKKHMALAPLTRVQCENAVLEELDRYLAKPDSTLDGLKDWTKHKPRRSGPTRPSYTNSARDCLVVTDSVKADGVPDRSRYGRMKLLHFHDNYRPAYWGTYSKKSKHISPRCPLRQDKTLLDYDVDSDEEWEEEEPGESLSHSEGDDDDEAGDDDDDDDGFFVPHGYLSEGEGALEEDEEGGDPEKMKVRQKIKAREWENELMSKGKVRVLEPVVRGCWWEGEEHTLDFMKAYAVCMLEPLPKDEACTPEQDISRQQRNKKLLSQLLPLLHGNVNSKKIIINEFLEFCRQQTLSPTENPQIPTDNIPPRSQVRRLIKESAVYEKRSTYRRCCWYVHADVLASHSQETLPVPCQWNYLTSGAQITREEPVISQGNSPTSVSTTPSNKRKSTSSHSITKYMKKCGESEQVEAMETDGFQADTEDDEDDDCIIVGEQSVSEQDCNKSLEQAEGDAEPMDTNTSETAALALPCPTPATA